MLNQGWICPKCGMMWAPWVDRCDCVQEKMVIEPFMPGPYIPNHPDHPFGPIPTTPQTGDPPLETSHTVCDAGSPSGKAPGP